MRTDLIGPGCLVVVALGVLGGCPKESPPAPAAAPQGGAKLAPDSTADGVVSLDEAKLKRFLQYQEQMTRANAELLKAAQAMEARYDGGLAGAPLPEATTLVQRQGEARERALKGSGFTQAEVDGIERMVSGVLGRRMFGQGANQDAMVEQLEETMARVPADQRGEFEQAIKQAKAARDAQKNLTQERKHYGDANVDLIVAHEQELRTHWMAMTAGLSGGKPEGSK